MRMAKGIQSNLTKVLVGLVIAEIATGAIMGYFAVPAVAQPVHLLLAVLIMGLQFAIYLMLRPALIIPKRDTQASRLLRI